jgi:hypothetical protein
MPGAVCDSHELLRAERDALREELAKAMPMQAQATCMPICGKRTASGFLCTLEPDHADVCIPLVEDAGGTIEVASDGRVFLHNGQSAAILNSRNVARLERELAEARAEIERLTNLIHDPEWAAKFLRAALGQAAQTAETKEPR